MLTGHDDLKMKLQALAERLQSLDLHSEAARLERAAAFRIGSPTEFLGESLYALDDSVADGRVPESMLSEMVTMADELERALVAAGYSPRRRRPSRRG